jgi:CubicO group peptidase (beta-lactamase class C family)
MEALNLSSTNWMRQRIRSIFLLVVAFTIANNLSAQALPDSIVTKINTLFDQWNKPNSPGCAVGIVRNDSLIFSKGYGMANLEYGIPNSDETIFHMASVSKQFTAFAIVLLARQGKLQLDDDIRKYLPWFPDLKEKITIRHLLNHTSGIRDQWQLLAIQGTRLDDVITQEHIIKILSKQQALNFKPGEEYSYSNSNFTLLAEIVRSVSGQSFRQFTDSAIFKPLGMMHTHFHDDYTEIVNNRADSYGRKDSAHYMKSILSYSNVVATSLFTNVKDMSKWISNFFDHTVGDQKDIDVLTTKTKLRNGKELNYAAGIVSDTYKGWRQFSHGGGDAGFRTFIAAFPDLKMGVIVFSNVGDFDPTGKAHQIAGFFAGDTTKKVPEIKEEKKNESSAAFSNNDSAFLQKYLGNYVADAGVTLTLEIKDSKLYYRAGGGPLLLKKDSANKYSMFYAPEIRFFLDIHSKDTTILVTTPDQKFVLKKYVTILPEDKALQAYTGRYYSPELDCSYEIVQKDHRLYLTGNKYNDMPLTFAGPGHLLTDFWWMDHLMVKRNKSDQITGFEISSGRVMQVAFIKIEKQQDLKRGSINK